MFSLPNLLTAGNLLCGVLAILLSVSGKLTWAPYAIFLGLIFDFLDGFAARMLKKSGELGKQLDSLADMITFGVAPGVIMMTFLTVDFHDLGGASEMISSGFITWMRNLVELKDVELFPLVGLIVPFLALFRLARFNIDTRQTESFLGVPTPANTLFLMVYPLSLSGLAAGYASESFYQIVYNPWFISVSMIVMSVMMIVELPLFSLKFKHFRWSGNQIRYVFLLISLIFILVFKVWSIALIVFLYLILSLVENTFFKKKLDEV